MRDCPYGDLAESRVRGLGATERREARSTRPAALPARTGGTVLAPVAGSLAGRVLFGDRLSREPQALECGFAVGMAQIADASAAEAHIQRLTVLALHVSLQTARQLFPLGAAHLPLALGAADLQALALV